MDASALSDNDEMDHTVVNMTESQVDALQRETGAIRYEQKRKFLYKPLPLKIVLKNLVFLRSEYMSMLKVCGEEATDAQLRGWFFAKYPTIAETLGIEPSQPKYITYVFNSTCRECKTDQWKDMMMMITKGMEHKHGSEKRQAAILRHGTQSKLRTQHRHDMHYVEAEPVPVEPMPDAILAVAQSRIDTDYTSPQWTNMATATKVVMDPTTVSGKPGDALKDAVAEATANVESRTKKGKKGKGKGKGKGKRNHRRHR